MLNAAEKLAGLRQVLVAAGVHGFFLPVADEYLGEYVPASAQRLSWLSGFTGSAGMAAVLADRAALFTDGRYTLQARQETNAALYEQHNSAQVKPEQWFLQHMPEGTLLGYDPMLHSVAAIEQMKKALAAKHIALTPLVPNPVDALWDDRPAAPSGQAFVHGMGYAGIPHSEKIAACVRNLREKDADAVVLAASDSINWLLNIRGRDLAYTPVVLAYALLGADGQVQLFADPQKFPKDVRVHLGEAVQVFAQEKLPDALAMLGARRARVLLDPTSTPSWFADALALAGAEVVRGADPCQLPKALKNAVELEGARRAHLRDGLAVTRLLHWLDKTIGKTRITEMEVSVKLLELRGAAREFVAPSFETISGSGPNGAIVHYRASEESNRELRRGELFLLDSGGQYLDGTTDVTRTIALGKPSNEQRTRFTLVLKGHIRLAMAHFPEGICGSQLDVLARGALWEAGLDYDHGTGHGVGSFLSVHEGPQRISKRGGDAALKPGMIISNEPGYYKEGAYGIRIESLVAVKADGAMESGAAQLSFETLTCVPVDRRLVKASLLSTEERAWLNAYHAWVYDTHALLLGAVERKWLKAACKKI